MYDTALIEDKTLKLVGLELMFCTPQKCRSCDGITTIELSKRIGLKPEIVRKKLKILFDAGIIRVVGINPKMWKFDDYSFQRMDTEDPYYKLLCNYDDVDFSKYFEY